MNFLWLHAAESDRENGIGIASRQLSLFDERNC